MRCEDRDEPRPDILATTRVPKPFRIIAQDVPASMANGMTDDQFVADFSYVTSGHIRSAAGDHGLTSGSTT